MERKYLLMVILKCKYITGKTYEFICYERFF